MTNHWQGGQTRVERLRLRGGVPDPTLARLRLTQMLGGARLHPPGLAPSAILCVRRLRGPAPGPLSARVACGMVSPAWEQAVTAALGDLARRAARPARAYVPADAEAVLFADEAEMLACYVGDCRAGLAGARWWWKGLFRGAETHPVRALLEAPACTPAVFEHLTRRGEAVAFVQTLGEREARALLRRVAHTYGLSHLQNELDAALDASRTADDTVGTRHAGGETFIRHQGSSPHEVLSRAPWHAHAPEGAGLGPAQQTLLGVCILLRRAPALARSQSFARATRLWLLDAVTPRPSAPRVTHKAAPDAEELHAELTTLPPPTFAAPEDEACDNANLVTLTHDARPAETRQEDARHAAPSRRPQTTDAAVVEVSELTTPDVQLPQTVEGRAVASERAADVVRQHEPPAHASRLNQQTASARPVPDATALRTASVETNVGGVFYLVNLALFLGLYGDFTTPAAPGIALDPWDFLALAGGRLTGTRHADDPVWPLLARLAGREEFEPPGRLYVPSDVWRVPAAWLGPFPERASLKWSAGEGRLRVRHPGGFLLLDLPLRRRDPEALLARELKAYAARLSFTLRHAPARAGDIQGANRRERWLTRLISYMRARLRRAFGLARTRDVGKFLCERHARVVVSATRVDVLFSLAELPIELRLSGVDRDPGWMPAAGRQIAFHYE